MGEFDYDNNNNSNNNINKQSLITDLTKYRNIKLVTKELGLKNKKLSKNILELENQKKILENYVNLILAIIFNLRRFTIIAKKNKYCFRISKNIIDIFIF